MQGRLAHSDTRKNEDVGVVKAKATSPHFIIMEKHKKPFKKKRKKKRGHSKKFYCTLCEKIVIKSNQIKTRKNYSHGKKSRATTTHTHACDGGCLVEVRKNE